MKEELSRLVGRARRDSSVLAVMVFGSFARGERYRDLDVCMVLKPKRYSDLQLSEKRLEYLSHVGTPVDLQVFQQLPLYVRERVFGEGKPLYVRDESALFDLAVDTHRSFEDYKPIYEEYLRGVADGG
ncbi:MAG: nucleotidyltransferase domain-containing protein [Candidatus Altiarchaeota archaeon]